MAVKSFSTNDLVKDHDIYVEFMKHRHAEMTENGDTPTPVLFYKPSLMKEGRTNKGGSNQRVYVTICKWHCISIAYDIWYDTVKDYAIDDGSTSYKKFVDVPKTALIKFKRRVNDAIDAAKCDYNMRINRGSGTYDACRYLAIFWTYLDCIHDEKTQRFFPTVLTIQRAAGVFGYPDCVHNNPFAMNGKFIHHKEEEKIVKVSENETPFDETPNNGDGHTLCTTIEDMALSMMTYNCLKRSGLNTLDDIIGKTPKQLLKIRNLGKHCFYEIFDAVKKYGYEYNKDDLNQLPTFVSGESVIDIAEQVVEEMNQDQPIDELDEKKKEIERLTKLGEGLGCKVVDADYLVNEINRLETKYKNLQDAYDKLEASHDAVVMENRRLLKSSNDSSDPIDLISKAVSGLRDKKIGKITTVIDGYEVDICLKYTIRVKEGLA